MRCTSTSLLLLILKSISADTKDCISSGRSKRFILKPARSQSLKNNSISFAMLLKSGISFTSSSYMPCISDVSFGIGMPGFTLCSYHFSLPSVSIFKIAISTILSFTGLTPVVSRSKNAIGLFVFSCSDLEFVYKSPKDLQNISSRTKLLLAGDDIDKINNYVQIRIKNPIRVVFLLSIESEKKVVASVIEKDATASQFSIEYNINYNLQNILENCLVLEKNIITINSYDSKSEGYSFGTDVAEEEISSINIKSNVDEFFNSLDFINNFSCKNED